MTVAQEIIEGYKMTEIGLLPEEWEVRAIKDVAEIKYGKANPHTQGLVPLVGSSGIFGWVEKPLIEKPTIIVGRKGTAGSIHLFLIPSYPTDTTFFLVFNNGKPDLKFLYYWMSLNKLSGEHAKTTLPSLQKADLENYEFAYPPLPEQQKIASVLSTVQEAKEKTKNVISALKELKKSMMKHLFTYGPVSIEKAERVSLKETEIGMIPEHWAVTELDNIAESFIGGGTPSTKNNDYWGGNLHWTTSKKIIDIYLKEGERTITKRGLDESSTHFIPKDNLIIGTRVGVGKVAINLIDIAISQDLTGVFINKDIYNLLFLAYQILSEKIQLIFQKQTRGTTIKGIPRDDLKKVLLGIPLLPEQKQVAQILSAIDEKIKSEESKKNTLEILFKTLLSLLMIGKIRVKDLEV